MRVRSALELRSVPTAISQKKIAAAAPTQGDRTGDEVAQRVVRASAPTDPLLAMPGSVLVVDDDAEFRVRAARLLQSRGYKVVGEASDAASAIDAAVSLRPSAMLVDVNLPDRDGYSVAEALKGSGIRDSARVLHVGTNTVLRELKKSRRAVPGQHKRRRGVLSGGDYGRSATRRSRRGR